MLGAFAHIKGLAANGHSQARRLQALLTGGYAEQTVVASSVSTSTTEQFPEFRLFAGETLNVLEREHSTSLGANKESQDKVHHAYQEVRSILADELKREDLPAEDRKIIIDKIMETANREFAKDSENKRFLDTLFGKAALAGGAAIALGMVVLGGRVLRDTNEDEDQPQQGRS
ncbi:hypothetical protein [Nocardioides sp.]|uniref:hypothetical protein n=1 Tax=Nocardioides sp. TaxID=35761 RepID=UPI0039E4F150